jgi:hypothetical protein
MFRIALNSIRTPLSRCAHKYISVVAQSEPPTHATTIIKSLETGKYNFIDQFIVQQSDYEDDNGKQINETIKYTFIDQIFKENVKGASWLANKYILKYEHPYKKERQWFKILFGDKFSKELTIELDNLRILMENKNKYASNKWLTDILCKHRHPSFTTQQMQNNIQITYMYGPKHCVCYLNGCFNSPYNFCLTYFTSFFKDDK